jgi:hypothetical protein
MIPFLARSTLLTYPLDLVRPLKMDVAAPVPDASRPHLLRFRRTGPAPFAGAAVPARTGVWSSTQLRAISLTRKPTVVPRLSAFSRKRVADPRPLALAAELSAKRLCLQQKALAPSTNASYASADAYFFEFCTMHGISYEHFGLAESEGGVCPPHLVSLHRSMLEDTERASLSMGRSAGGTLGPANGPALGSRYAR